MASTLRFLLNGELVEQAAFDPHLTLLDFLREQRRLTGTKEGCNEGDCGACTVVIGELTQAGAGPSRVDRVSLAPINACIRLLATLDGKAVFTVESLKAPSGALHPTQQAMVDCHGAQGGFCTPGFVMSLFAWFKTCLLYTSSILRSMRGAAQRQIEQRALLSSANHPLDDRATFAPICLDRPRLSRLR